MNQHSRSVDVEKVHINHIREANMKQYLITAYLGDNKDDFNRIYNDEQEARDKYNELKENGALALYLCEIIDKYGHTY